MLLRNEGLIEAIHGLGCFVRQPEPVERVRPDLLGHGWEIGRDPDDPPLDDDPRDTVASPPGASFEELLIRGQRAGARQGLDPGCARGRSVRLRRPRRLPRAKAPVFSAWAIQDSNLGPLPYQRSALTD
jgi:hypothetical protein